MLTPAKEMEKNLKRELDELENDKGKVDNDITKLIIENAIQERVEKLHTLNSPV